MCHHLFIIFWTLILLISCDSAESQPLNIKGDTELPTLPNYDQYAMPSDMNIMIDLGGTTTHTDMSGGTLAGMMGGSVVAGMIGGGSMAGSMAGNDVDVQPNAQGLIILDEEIANQWALTRDCAYRISVYAPGINEVKLAGEFTNWAENPLNLTPVGNGMFELLLDESMGLQANERYAYKLIKDGRWVIDEGARLRKYDGNCMNAAFEFPNCQQAQVLLDQLNTNASQVQASFRIYQPSNARLKSIEVKIDQQPMTVSLDPSAGLLSVVAPLNQGKHRLDISVQDQNGISSQALSIPFWIEESAFLWKEQALYLLLIDRFANGDPSNDRPLGGAVYPEVDWHGGDLIGAQRVLEQGYFDQLGIKAIWLSPVNQQTDGDFGDREIESRRIAAYHGYWPIRAREVEPRFGGNQALKNFVNAAHQRGIRIILDLINNQVHQEHEYYLSHRDWFRTNCICGTFGCGWSEKPLECLFASYLPDINWRNQDAERQFIDDALAWVEDYDIDGFRVDAVKHVESSAIFNLRYALDQRFGDGLQKNIIGELEPIDRQRIIMLGETAVGEGDRYDDQCGEVFNNGYEWISGYMGEKALDGQFDFPTHHRIRWQLLSGAGSFEAVDSAFRSAQSNYPPESLMVSFIGSHDTSRVISEAEQGMFFGCAWGSECETSREVMDLSIIQRLWRAWVVLYTQSLIPLLYYGDEVGIPGGIDPDNRRNMQFLDTLNQYQIDMNAPQSEVNVLQAKQLLFLQTLGMIKANYKTLMKAEYQRRLFVTSSIWVYAYQKDQQWLVIAMNQNDQAQSINIDVAELIGVTLEKKLNAPEFNEFIGDVEIQTNNNRIQIDLSAHAVQIFASP